MLTLSDLNLAIGAGFASSVLIYFMGRAVSAAMDAISAASDVPAED